MESSTHKKERERDMSVVFRKNRSIESPGYRRTKKELRDAVGMPPIGADLYKRRRRSRGTRGEVIRRREKDRSLLSSHGLHTFASPHLTSPFLTLPRHTSTHLTSPHLTIPYLASRSYTQLYNSPARSGYVYIQGVRGFSGQTSCHFIL